MASGEKRLLKKVGRYIPPGAHVVAVEVASANPIDEQRRPTPVVMTEHGLVLVTSAGSTAVVTHVPFHRVSRTRTEGNVLGIDFLDEENRPRTFEADFGRAGSEFIGKFLHQVSQVRRDTEGDDERAPVQSFHVAWSEGRGATLDVFDDKHIRPRYDEGVAGINAAELCKQAMMTLAQAIAANPDLVWVRPQPEWMPDLVWTPPLPQRPEGRA